MLDRIAEWSQRIAKCTHTLVAAVCTYSGLVWLRHRLRRPRILVLAYHRVTPDVEIGSCAFPEMHVSTTHFEKQLTALRRFYRVVSMSELQRILASAEPLREHLAAVTFDGGYQDNFEHALPILERQGVSATFFLSTGFVDGRRSPWFDRLADVMQAWDDDPRARRALRSSMPARLAGTFADAKPRGLRLRRAATFLDSLPIHERRSIMKRLMPRLAALERPGARALAWSEVQQMAERGMEFGALGVTHTTFTRLSVAEARREMHHSMHRVAQQVGRTVTAFAYPNGIADDEVVYLAEESGARVAFTLEERENQSHDHPLRLGRRTVHQGTSRDVFGRFSSARFWCEITGIFDALSRRRSSTRHAFEPDESNAPTAVLEWTGPQDSIRQRSSAATLGSASAAALHAPRPGVAALSLQPPADAPAPSASTSG